MKQYTASIRQFIANAQLKEAISELHELLRDSPQLDQVILQSARLSDIHRQVRNGLVDLSEARITKNQISLALLDILTEVDNAAEYNPTIRREVEIFTTQKIKKQINQHNQSGNNYAGDFVGGHKTGDVKGSFHGGNVVHGSGQIFDVGLDRAVDTFGKQTTSFIWKAAAVVGILLLIGAILLVKQENDLNLQNEINAKNSAIGRMKSDLVDLRKKHSNSPIQTMTDFEDFNIDKTVEAANRCEYQISFNSSSSSLKAFSGKMVMIYNVSEIWWQRQLGELAEYRDLSQPKIFGNSAPKSNPEPEPVVSIQPTKVTTDAPEDQVTELLKLGTGQPARVLVEITMTGGLNIRDGQNVEGTNVLATIPYQGKAVVKKVGKRDVVRDYEHYWYFVEYNGVEGWVWGRWLKFPD